MNYLDDDLARNLRRELHGSLVPFDPARAQHMIDEAIAASPVRRVLHSRWTMPLLASGAVAAVVGGVAGAAALHPDSKPGHPGGGPTVTVPATVQHVTPAPTLPRVSPTPTLPQPPIATTSPALPQPPVATTSPTRPQPPIATTSPSLPQPPVATTSPSLPQGSPTVPSGLTPVPGRG